MQHHILLKDKNVFKLPMVNPSNFEVKLRRSFFSEANDSFDRWIHLPHFPAVLGTISQKTLLGALSTIGQ